MPDRVGRRDRPAGLPRASKMVVDIRDVALNGPYAQRKPLGNLAVGEALRDQSHHLALTPRQRNLCTLRLDWCDSTAGAWDSRGIGTILGARRTGGLPRSRRHPISLRS